MKRKLVKRVLTFMMLLALLISTASPIFTYAEELPKDEETKDIESVGSMEEGQESEEDELEVQSEGVDNTEDGEEIDKNNNDQYDVTKPVIEKIEFPQQGATVKANDTIQLYIYAYDTGTEEGALEVDVSISAVGTNDYGYGDLECSYDEKEKRYVCSYTLNGANAEKIAVTSIRVTDKAKNYIDYTCYDYDEREYKYWFNIEQQELKKINIKKFELKQNGQILKDANDLEMFFELEEEIEEGYRIYVSFANKTETREFSFYSEDSSNKKEFDYYRYSSGSCSDGEWELKDIYVTKGTMGRKEFLQIDDIGDCQYIIKKNETETETATEKPVITSVSVERNGEMLVAGEQVKITVRAESSGLLNKKGFVEFQAASGV